eukprot:GGOE01028221.1.p1 GENE.GGOE01028221.1~~GGOE01028221.1.p1  ORF type:complete len:106 (+),score=7.49 GGOE01028221.1:395-712(+)
MAVLLVADSKHPCDVSPLLLHRNIPPCLHPTPSFPPTVCFLQLPSQPFVCMFCDVCVGASCNINAKCISLTFDELPPHHPSTLQLMCGCSSGWFQCPSISCDNAI